MNDLVFKTTQLFRKTLSLKQAVVNHVLLRTYRGSRFKRLSAILKNEERDKPETVLGREEEPFEFPKRHATTEPTVEIDNLDKYLEFPSDTLRYWQKLKDEQKKSRDQTKHSFRPKVDPRNTSIILFPGQGSQFVGMGEKLLGFPKVKEMYKTASRILGYNLLEICLNGPKEVLNKTIHCQPAIVVTSLAAVEKLKYIKPSAIENCITTAGYSVGEISSLVFSGAITFEDAIRLVKTRAEAMQWASTEIQGRMMTIFISPETKLKFACSAAKLFCTRELNIENPVCGISNYIHPTCKVISGNSEALEFIARNAKEFGIKRATYLPVSGAFHSHLMMPTKRAVYGLLKNLQIEEPIMPVHSNVTGHPFKSNDDIRKLLLQQIYQPVLWEQTMHALYTRSKEEFFPRTFEVGPGKQLGQILKMVNARAYEDYENVEV